SAKPANAPSNPASRPHRSSPPSSHRTPSPSAQLCSRAIRANLRLRIVSLWGQVNMNNSFASHLYDSFRSTYGPVFAFFGVVATLLAYFVVPNTAVIMLRWLFIIVLLCVFVFLILFHAAW